jgi:O-antigen ligase
VTAPPRDADTPGRRNGRPDRPDLSDRAGPPVRLPEDEDPAELTAEDVLGQPITDRAVIDHLLSGRALSARRRARADRPAARLAVALVLAAVVLGVLAGFGVLVASDGPISLVWTVLGGLALVLGVVRWAKWNELTVFSLLLITTFAMPATLVVGPLGQAGVPSHLVSALLLVLWLIGRASPGVGTDYGRQPVRLLAAALIASQLASYVAGLLRGLSPLEASGANAAVLGLTATVGLLVFTADALPTLAAIQKLVYRLLCGGVVLAVAGMLQFFNIYDLARNMHIPGLVNHAAVDAFVETRSGFNRVAGLATHPIEYGVVLSMLLPLALHSALFGPVRYRKRLWLALVVIAAGIPLAVGRSAVLTSGIALLLYVITLRLKVLGRLLPFALIGLVGMQVAVPGLLTSIRNLFRNTSNDPSIQGRTDDYAHILAIFREHPLFGLGPGTYIPTLYRVLDNEYLYDLATLGAVGSLVILMIYLLGYSLGQRVRAVSTDPAVRSLGNALSAALVGGAAASFTFDAFGFSIMYVMVHVLVGITGALWRVVVRDGPPAGPGIADAPVRVPRPRAA